MISKWGPNTWRETRYLHFWWWQLVGERKVCAVCVHVCVCVRAHTCLCVRVCVLVSADAAATWLYDGRGPEADGGFRQHCNMIAILKYPHMFLTKINKITFYTQLLGHNNWKKFCIFQATIFPGFYLMFFKIICPDDTVQRSCKHI